MKRRLMFFVFLILALLVVYLQPVFFPRQAQTIRPHDSQATGEGTITNMQADPVAAEGFATEIGSSLKDFEKTHGAPIISYDSGYGFTISRYETEETGFLEVNSEDGEVVAIKSTGIDGQEIAPFSLNMSMGDLAAITMLFPNFTIDDEGAEIQIELMEEDLNYRPLLVFDNGVYGILFFNRNSELYGVMYLTKDMLLKLAPYNLISGEVPAMKAQATEWGEINQAKIDQGFQLLNALRLQEELPLYETTYTLQGQGRDFLTRFLKNPQKHLSESRYESFRKVTEDASNEVFMVTGSEFTDLAKAVGVADIQGFFETPCYDLTFQILSWYSDPYMHARFMEEQKQAIAIGISQQNMVILFEDVAETEDSD